METKAQLDSEVAERALTMINCPENMVNSIRQYAAALTGQIYTIDQILNLEEHYPTEEEK